MPETEKPLIHIDHRIYHDEPKVILSVFDLKDIPEKVEFSIHTIRGLDDDVLREFRKPPRQWLNHWAKLDYGKEPVPVLFDTGGHPYIMVPSKRKPDIVVKALIHEQGFEDVLELLEVAVDFCDYCLKPLPAGEAGEWLGYCSGGGSIADVRECSFCERENIRWDRDFVEEHPSLEGLELRTR